MKTVDLLSEVDAAVSQCREFLHTLDTITEEVKGLDSSVVVVKRERVGSEYSKVYLTLRCTFPTSLVFSKDKKKALRLFRGQAQECVDRLNESIKGTEDEYFVESYIERGDRHE